LCRVPDRVDFFFRIESGCQINIYKITDTINKDECTQKHNERGKAKEK